MQARRYHQKQQTTIKVHQERLPKCGSFLTKSERGSRQETISSMCQVESCTTSATRVGKIGQSSGHILSVKIVTWNTLDEGCGAFWLSQDNRCTYYKCII